MPHHKSARHITAVAATICAFVWGLNVAKGSAASGSPQTPESEYFYNYIPKSAIALAQGFLPAQPQQPFSTCLTYNRALTAQDAIRVPRDAHITFSLVRNRKEMLDVMQFDASAAARFSTV